MDETRAEMALFNPPLNAIPIVAARDQHHVPLRSPNCDGANKRGPVCSG
jgi:hypothetical protein